MDIQNITNLRIERQHLIHKADESQYLSLYRDLQPGQNVYWNGFGDPPSLSFRAGFDDIAFNRARQNDRSLVKGRFVGGNLGWIMREDLELFACLFQKPLDKPTHRHLTLLELIEREGPLTIQQMKEATGYLVKEITPILHRLQEAFLLYEDQYDGEWDRGWYRFGEIHPAIDLARYTKSEALKVLLQRFAYRHVVFDEEMARSFYKLPLKEIKQAVEALLSDGILTKHDSGYLLQSDLTALHTHVGEAPRLVYALHRNDFLVKSNEHWLKKQFAHPEHDTLQYLLINGQFHGAVMGHFRNGPYDLEDIVLDLAHNEAIERKDEILKAVYAVNFGGLKQLKRYCGHPL